MTDINRLLVVDDQADILEFIATVAEFSGYRVATAQNAERAFSLLREFEPTLIMLDLQMPDMDGVELIRRLAVHGTRAPIVISSGMDSRVLASVEQLGLTQGLNMIGNMQKPLALPDLEALLASQLVNALEPTERDLKHGIEKGELTVYYQPQADLALDGSVPVVGVEALVRWNHPQLGLVLPDQFIGLAERTGLIGELTHFVLNDSLTQLANWRSQGLKLGLAVNLSPLLVKDLDFPDQLSEMMRARKLTNSDLTIEITETAALEDPALTRDILTRLRVKNFGLSLDDFGTGHSSLTQLYKMPFNELKIDRSLGMEMHSSAEARTITRSLIDLAHNLGLTVCTEGVEQAATVDFLREVRSNRIQGYWLARPMSAALVPDAIARIAQRTAPQAISA